MCILYYANLYGNQLIFKIVIIIISYYFDNRYIIIFYYKHLVVEKKNNSSIFNFNMLFDRKENLSCLWW